MGLRPAGLCLLLVLAEFASAQSNSYRIFETFHGRFHCNGQWTEFNLKMSPVAGPLGIVDDDDSSITGSVSFLYHRSVTSMDGVTYRLRGTHDAKTGRFHLEPKEWYGPHPAVFEMFGIEGTFDAENLKMKARMLSPKCDAVEMVAPGEHLKPLPDRTAVANPATAPNNARPERCIAPSNVTSYLDPASFSPDFEYWVTAWSDPPGTVHEGDPIDESVAELKKEKFVCVGSQRVSWDASGTKGTAPDQVGITERFVIECVGNCKGVFYRPYVGANVTHLGLSAPLPTMQIKSVSFGGTTFRWNFSRKNGAQPPPEVYIHRWAPLAGFGPLDPDPTELARRQAAAPPCRVPKGNNR
jgi:hypothetical protein